MQRKRPSETVERFIARRIRPEGEALRKRIETWAAANRGAILAAYENLDADFLADRDLENWEPLLAILAVADPSRLQELKRGAEILTARKAGDGEDDSLSLRLLGDLRQVWPENVPKMFTDELLRRLKKVEDGPWVGDERFDARRLARHLRPFGVTPQTVQIGSENRKGYYREHAEEAFLRYLVASQPSESSEPA